MKLTLQITDEHNYVEEEMKKELQNLLQTAAEVEGIDEGEVSLTFVDDEQIQHLNADYRDKNQPTDVLSFPMYENAEDINVFEDEPVLLGDIVISIPRAKEQAEEYGHSFKRELGFLSVHGFLHLIGYDHMDEEAEQEMFAKQEEILQKHGITR